MYLINGSKVPADVCLLETASFKVENAALTGESEPQELDALDVTNNSIKIQECCNMALQRLQRAGWRGVWRSFSYWRPHTDWTNCKIDKSNGSRESTMAREVTHFVGSSSFLQLVSKKDFKRRKKQLISISPPSFASSFQCW